VPTKPETFFVGKDVALALGDSKPENAIANHVDIEYKTTALIQGTGSNYKANKLFSTSQDSTNKKNTLLQFVEAGCFGI
jgi:prophage antirepressor-like protein